MGRPGTSRLRAAHPQAHGSDRRAGGDGRLDPVRWRRPAGGMLLRLAAVAVLLCTAALASWSTPQSCGEQMDAAVASRAAAAPTATSGGRPQAGGSGGEPQAAGGSADGSPLDRAPHGAPAIPAGRVGVPVRLADPTALSLLRVGNRVDLLRLDDAGGRTTSVAAAALVLEVTDANDPTTGGLLLALSPAEAVRAVATTGHGFAVLVRPD